MGVVFRADVEPPTSRTDYWAHVLEDTLGPATLREGGALDSGDRLRLGDAGAVRVVDLSVSDEHVAERRPTHIRQMDPDLYKIAVQAHGRGLLEQNGREAAMAPGDLTLVDLSRPYRWDYSRSRFVAAVFPRALLPLHAGALSRATAVPIPGDCGLGALVSSLVRQLPDRLDDCGPTDQARLGTAVLDLVAAALAALLDSSQDVPPDSRQRALLLRVLAFIEERLGDSELSPANIAAAHFISVRYLYKLFETQQTTVAEWIRQRRMERCRRDLLDPALWDMPVNVIAGRWGFSSAAHFSRAFRAAHGVPPAAFRAHHTARRSQALG
jgi:AraC-like DNA-binding protein